MKRSLIVFLALLFFSAGALGFAYADIGNEQENVGLVTTDVQGDRIAANGLRIETDEQAGEHLAWHTAHTIEPEGAISRTFYYFQQPQNTFYWREGAVNLVGAVSGSYYGAMDGTDPYIGQPDWSEIWSEVAAGVPADSSKTEIVYLKDYYDYLPLGLILTFTGENGVQWGGDPNEKKLYDQINQQIRIAVPQDLCYRLTVHKDAKGSLDSWQGDLYGTAAGEEAYEVETASTVTPGAVYFVVKNRTSNGTLLDVSATEDYGIYRIGTTGDVNGETFSLDDHFTAFYPIDASHTEVRALSASTDGKQLYLVTCEDEKLMLTVLDAATATMLQRIPLLTPEQRQSSCYLFAYEDFVLVACGEEPALEQFTLLSRSPDGTLQWEFSHRLMTASDADPIPGAFRYTESPYFTATNVSMAWKNGKLAVTQAENNGVSVAVYDKTGVLYLGFDKTNLDSEGLVYSDNAYYYAYNTSISTSWE